jgi:hypothetical protein
LTTLSCRVAHCPAAVLQVSVLTHKQHEVTVEARISTTNGPSRQQEEAISCGDFFVSVGDDACSNWFYQI